MASFSCVVFLLFFVTLSLLAAGQSPNVDDSVTVRPCCFPNVWEGRLVAEFGFAGRSTSNSPAVYQLYVDGANHRVAGDKLEFQGQGRSTNVTFVILFRANRTADMYLFNRGTQRCRHRTLRNTAWQRQCIPDTATLTGAFSLGPSAGGLNVQSWAFDVGSNQPPSSASRPRPRMTLSANILVIPRSCIPVVVQEHGSVRLGDEVAGQSDSRSQSRRRPREISFIGSVYFTGVQPWINDPTVFNPPAYCQHSADGSRDVEEDQLASVLERMFTDA